MSVFQIKRLIIFIIISIFLIQIGLIIFSNTYDLETVTQEENKLACNDYIKTNLDKISNNEGTEFIKKEISIIPNYSNFFCLNKIKSITPLEKVTVEYYFSTNFYKIIFCFSQLLLLNSFFFLNKKKFYYATSLAMSAVQMFMLNPNFYNKELVYEMIFLTMSNFILFYLFTREKKVFVLFDYFTLSLIFLLFNSYQIFSNILIIYFLIFYKLNLFKNPTLLRSYKSVIYGIPLFYYLLKLTTGLSENFSFMWKSLSNNIYETTKIFGDFQIILRTIHCNSSDFIQDFKFGNGFHSCPFETGYPLVDYNLSFDINNIWLTSVFFGVVVFVILSYLYIQTIKTNNQFCFFIFLLVLSSPVNFLYDRLNLDILVVLLSYIAIKYYRKHYIISTMLIVLLFTIKIYPIFILISIVILELKNKNWKLLGTNTLGLILSSIYLYFIVFINNSRLTATNNPNEIFQGTGFFNNDSNTFGLLAHIKYLNKYMSLSVSIFCFLAFMILLVYGISKIKNKLVIKNDVNEYIYLITSGSFVLIALFENFDYKLCYILLIFKYILENKDKNIFLTYMIVFLTSATVYNLFNSIFVIVNIISLTYLIQFFAFDFFNFIIKNQKRSGTEVILSD